MPNAILNPSFEDGTNNWTVGSDWTRTAGGHEGSYYMKSTEVPTGVNYVGVIESGNLKESYEYANAGSWTELTIPAVDIDYLIGDDIQLRFLTDTGTLICDAFKYVGGDITFWYKYSDSTEIAEVDDFYAKASDINFVAGVAYDDIAKVLGVARDDIGKIAGVS